MNQIKRSPSFIQPIGSVNKKSRSSPNSCFENFSNELFYEIFDYLDGCNIYHAFTNLNIRFQNLLTYSSIPMKVDFGCNSSLTLEHRCRHFIIPNKHRLLSLHLRGETLIERFFNHCIIDSSFHHLESITLHGVTDHRLLWVLFYFNSLPRLFSLTICIEEEYCFHLGDIYRLIFSLPVLKHNTLTFFHCDEIDIVMPNVINEKFSSITSLVINHPCTLDQLTSLLRHTPQLYRLTCGILNESDENVQAERGIILSYLRYISIGGCFIDFEELEVFMKAVSSQLQVLRIRIFWNTNYLDANRWEQLIKKHMPQLNKFYLNYEHYTDTDFSTDEGYTFIDQFTSPFWLERKWLSKLKINSRDIFFSIHPYRKEWYNSSEHMKNDTYSIPFTVEGDTTIEQIRLFISQVKSSDVKVQCTHLNIKCNDIHLEMLVEIIRLLPHLHSLEISPRSSLPLNSSTVEDIKNELLLSIRNKIIMVKLNELTKREQLQCLLNLCSQMQYLEVTCVTNTDLEMLMKCILVNRMTHTPNLSCICLNMPNADEKLIENLAMIIDLETLVDHYTIQRIGEQIFLHWKLE